MKGYNEISLFVLKYNKYMNIELREWSNEMAEDFATICNRIDRTHLTNRIPYPYTTKDAEDYFLMARASEGKSGLFRAVFVDGKLEGAISLERKQDIYCVDAEIGYFLDSEVQGQGVMKEAIAQIVSLGFQNMPIIRITALVNEPNIPSRKALEANGFQLEGIMKKASMKDGVVKDVCIYGIVKPDEKC